MRVVEKIKSIIKKEKIETDFRIELLSSEPGIQSCMNEDIRKNIVM